MSIEHAAVPLLIAALSTALAPPPPAAAQQSARASLTAEAEATAPAVRQATERFRDVEVALAEGYIPDPTGMCIDAGMEGAPAYLGGMGIHYFRPDLLGITGTEPRVSGAGLHTDFTNPSVLVYEPHADGTLELVAVENLIFASGWREAGNTSPPAYHGVQYHYLHDNPETEVDEAHGFEPHYELHMWVFRDNPNGMFMPFNPNAGCEGAAPHPTGSHAAH